MFELSQRKPVNTEVRKAARSLAAAQAKLEGRNDAVLQWEVLIGLTQAQRWTKTDAAYLTTLKYMSQKAFVRAAEALRGAVVSRLMELAKLNAAGLGAYACKPPARPY